jgi:predicted porin
MKKTLIASAVAAAALSTSAFAMDPATDLAERLDSMPEIYGNIQLAHVSQDDDGDTAHEMVDNGSTLGFKHSSAISEGMEAFFKAEFHFDADDKKTGESLGEELDEAYIGVKGRFGSIQAGTDDTVFEWVDMNDRYEAIGIEGEIADLDEGDNLQYVSPEIMKGLVVGVTAPVDSDTAFGGALAAKFTGLENLEVAFAYAIGREDAGGAGNDTVGIAASYTLGDNITLIAQVESQEDTSDFIGVQGVYTMGQNVFALGVSSTSADDSAPGVGDVDAEVAVYLQALHNMSDNMYVYLEYLAQADAYDKDAGDNTDIDTLAIGATYAF